ncbi:cobalt transporter CbiM [Campylobacter sp.]|uniref:cobalt transporter CbiM n=1 Tax=Campylobacter sp. TaxID=205 RepID=UPI0026F5A675|nr:cobalt transporter CbiM [Campylobacter sp.]
MHISEGILSGEILAAGWAISGTICAYALYKLEFESIPKVAMLTALFFLGSFIHIPVGPSSVHLLFNGIIGALGGVQAFLAIMIALFFQALLYGFGGIGVLGVNTFIMAAPAVLVWYFLKPYLNSKPNLISFVGGFLPVLLSVGLLIGVLLINSVNLDYAVYMIFAFNLPLMIIEGLISVFTLRFIIRYKPNFL